MDSPIRPGIPFSHPFSMFTSDLSSSSGPSRTSTRDTTPDFHHHPPGSHLTSAIEPPCGLVDPLQLSGMDHNPFDTVNARRTKIYFERAGHAQSNDLRDHIPTSNPRHLASRNITSANWRSPGSNMDEASFACPSTPASFARSMASPSPTRYGGGYGPVGGGPPGLGAAGTNDFSLVSRAAGQAQIGNSEPHETYAYCFDRGNGQYTRLIPADMLPPLQEIPALQQGCAGMKVLAVPRGLAPNGRSSNSERVALQPRTGPHGNIGDPIQSHIDNIIASSPPPSCQKRPKIYCDKWVHEGVCAFTQQGCKYKHEMPFDKATQHSLGLFHGLPAWWKKHQAELARQRDLADSSDQPVAVTSSDRSLAGPNRVNTTAWRRAASSQLSVGHFASPFGPIGPPPRKPICESSPDRLARGIADMNPFSMLGQVEENGNDDTEEGERVD